MKGLHPQADHHQGAQRQQHMFDGAAQPAQQQRQMGWRLGWDSGVTCDGRGVARRRRAKGLRTRHGTQPCARDRIWHDRCASGTGHACIQGAGLEFEGIGAQGYRFGAQQHGIGAQGGGRGQPRSGLHRHQRQAVGGQPAGGQLGIVGGAGLRVHQGGVGHAQHPFVQLPVFVRRTGRGAGRGLHQAVIGRLDVSLLGIGLQLEQLVKCFFLGHTHPLPKSCAWVGEILGPGSPRATFSVTRCDATRLAALLGDGVRPLRARAGPLGGAALRAPGRSGRARGPALRFLAGCG